MNRVEDGYNNVDEYEDEYESRTLFLFASEGKPFEDLSTDEIIERISILRSYMNDLSNRVEEESDEVPTLRTLYPKGIFSTKRDLSILLGGNLEAYETKTIFGAYVMYLNVLSTEDVLSCIDRDKYDPTALPFENYYDLVRYRIYGVPTEKTALDIFDIITKETLEDLAEFYVCEIKINHYNLNTAVKSSNKE